MPTLEDVAGMSMGLAVLVLIGFLLWIVHLRMSAP